MLLNNGRRVQPQPDTSSRQQDTPISAPPPATSFSGNKTGPTKDTPVEELLYREEIAVGSRGDVIEFYNKVFIGLVKDFVLKFSPCDDVSCACVQC